MPRSREILQEIAEVRQRRQFGVAMAELSFRLGALERAFANHDREDEELVRYFPVAIVACVEGYLRMAIKDLVDTGEPFLSNAERAGAPLKLDFGVLRAVHGNAVTVWSCPGFVDTYALWSEEVPMPRSHPPYPSAFRARMVELVRSGRNPEELAREFEPSAQAIRNWVAQADRDEGRREDGMTTPEREELARLRRENRQLRQEREILSKAAAWFARETGSIPPGSSDS